MHDFLQHDRPYFSVRERRKRNPGYEGILSVLDTNHVDFDLRGHLISGAPYDDAVGAALIAGASVSQSDLKTYSDLRIHNGRIQTPGLHGAGVFWALGKYPPSKLPEYLAPEDLPPMLQSKYNLDSERYTFSKPWDYTPPTRYTAENLQITSGGRGIIMSGADNVVRNNVIEVDGKVAVYLYGPRPVVEGNTFIVRMDPRDNATLPAVLKLRDAEGAIIRNNRFIIQNSGQGEMTMPWANRPQSEAAINLLNSPNVLIENNTVEGTRELVRKDAASTTVEQGNTLK